MFKIKKILTNKIILGGLLFSLCLLWGSVTGPKVSATTLSNSGSVGLQATISAPPPTQGATISLPRDGQSFTQLPVTVSGLCPSGLLVKLFKNNVFGGSVQCTNGSFSLVTDLFSGTNELIARVYDNLDQPGPDSNKVTVNFNSGGNGSGPRVTLTSNFAKRGANPGEVLSWPITLSGGIGPYALNIDWGDGKTADLMSEKFPGTITIQHTYDRPGVNNVIVRATDSSGGVAYLQLVGIANGPLSQDNTSSKVQTASATSSSPKIKILWQPAAILIPFILSTFWLGKRYELKMLRRKIERGDRPF
ncbi:MAG: hypothetical protein NVSMB46_08020 [Candidatus Saccharimonadales bacterium]